MKPLDLKNSLMKDAAECQRRNGKLPDTVADDEFWQEQLSELDLRKAAAKPRAVSPRMSRAIEHDGAEIVDTSSDEISRMIPVRGAVNMQSKLACTRLNILKRVPEWRTKVIAAIDRGEVVSRTRGIRDMRLCIWTEVRKVLEESNAALGRWDRAPERKITTA